MVDTAKENEEEAITLLTLSHLLLRAQPLTATASLTSKLKQHPPHPPPPEAAPKTTTATPTSTKANPIILSPLNHSAILIGTLKLPSETMHCSNKNCFQFSDDSSTVCCCDILHFHPLILGKLIRILAWNFIPSKHCSGGGFMEIIKWKVECPTFSLSSCSSLDSIRLVSSTVTKEGKSKQSYCVHGSIVSVSPVSIVPCSTGDAKSQNLRGFVMEILVCECSLCKSKNKSNATFKEFSGQGEDQHLFMKQLFVYFYGSAWRWHPAITKLIGNLVTLSGLKKKLIFVRKEESQLMFVTTENSILHIPTSLCKKKLAFSRNVIKGEGESGFYTGVVKGVYMQGMVVELDNEVWLLLTDQLLTAPHSLRVGAIISVRNVHFVNPKFSWTKMLILGACFRTSIIVESFSPLETGCRILFQSLSRLVKFIASLTFSARLWALLIISCFRKKFAGILLEKEILGSQHKEGLAQMFTSSHFPPSVFQARHGVLTEILMHGSCGCCNEPQLGNLKLVTPLSAFLGHCQAICMRQLLMLQKNGIFFHDNTAFSFQSPEGRPFGRPLRATISSEDLGVVLVGVLKICPSSGRLQLVDATGSIDVIVPDLPYTWRANRIYEVVNYTLVMEGGSDLGGPQGLVGSESMSCRDVFNYIPCSRKMTFSIYAYFHSRNITCKTISFHPHKANNDDFEDLQCGRYHMIWVTHKYPLLQKFPGDPILSDKSVFFVEIIVLAWDLFLGGREETIHLVDFSGSGLCKSLKHNAGEKEENLPKKKRKTDKASVLALSPGVTSGYSYDGNDLGPSSSYCSASSGEKFENLNFLEILCLATFRRTRSDNLFSSGRLHCTKCKLGISPDYKQIAYKVLLEFNSENFSKYQFLQIGSYYIIKHHNEDSFCSITDHDNPSSRKVLATSRIHLWSLSLSSAEAVNRSQEDLSPDGSSPSNKDKLMGDQVELLHCYPSESCSDVHLIVSASVFSLLEVRLNELKELTKSTVTQKENFTASPHTSTVMSSSSSLFPDGNLISVLGRVDTIHDIDCNSASVHSSCEILADVFHVGLVSGIASSLCIHVLVDNQMVSIFSSRTYVYPVGFGPGAIATFHRVLKLRGANSLMLTPVSFIVIDYIKVANEPFHQKSANVWSSVHDPTAASLDNVSSGMISQLIQRIDSSPLKLNCRVVAIHFLLLEYNKYDLQSNVHFRQNSVGIPLVGFVLDDGSSSCCCWANAERAETLLRLHEELPLRACFEITGCTLKWVGRNRIFLKSTKYHLERILKRHGKVTVKNYGSVVDSSSQDLAVFVNSADGLSSSDENLLKVIILNACVGKSWAVVACVMDSDASKRMEKEHLVHMETMAMNSMPNVWAMEVCHTDTLTAARNMAQELANSNYSTQSQRSSGKAQ